MRFSLPKLPSIALPPGDEAILDEDDRKPRLWGVRRAAIWETLFYLIMVTILSYALGDTTRFMGVAPHPFWVILLLVTVQYKTEEALACALLCTLFLLVGNLPVQRLDQSLYDYWFAIAQRPFGWFMAAVLLGQFRSRQVHQKRRLQKRVRDLEDQNRAITRAYRDVKDIKETLEIRLASEMSGMITIYENIKRVETLKQTQLLLNIDELVKTALQPNKFSIYAHGPAGLESVISRGWQKEEPYARRFTAEDNLYKEIVAQRRMLCVINENDAELLRDQGILAAPLIDPDTETVFGMLKIEEMDFTDLTIGRIHSFEAICSWIGAIYANAGKYQKALHTSMAHPDTGLLTPNYLEHQQDILREAGMKYVVTTLQLTDSSLSPVARTQIFQELNHFLLNHNISKALGIFSKEAANRHAVILFIDGTLTSAKQKWKRLKTALKKEGGVLADLEFEVDFKNVRPPQKKKAAKSSA